MTLQKRAIRPKPRVALVGNFSQDFLDQIKSIFPTIWKSPNYEELEKNIDHREIDLLILNDITTVPEWINQVHLITFSGFMACIPGPNKTWITMSEGSKTEEYMIPELELAKHNLLERDLKWLKSAKNLRLLKIQYQQTQSLSEFNNETEIFFNSSLFYDPHTKQPYAAIFNRNRNNKGIAILPGNIFSKVPWIKLIAVLWSKIDEDTFSNFSDWHNDRTWLSNDELEIKNEIDDLLGKKEKLISQIDNKIQELNKLLIDKTFEANNGIRRLLTAQGDDLVNEVGKSFESFGFSVKYMDNELTTNQPKREDLRLSEPESQDWEAIVEVRGYSKSSGQTYDLSRLNRFAEFYLNEKGKLPDKRIYVINGQIELMPTQRQRPMLSAKEDIEIFKEQNGLIISTINLFKLLKEPEEKKAIIKEKIKNTFGVLSVIDVKE